MMATIANHIPNVSKQGAPQQIRGQRHSETKWRTNNPIDRSGGIKYQTMSSVMGIKQGTAVPTIPKTLKTTKRMWTILSFFASGDSANFCCFAFMMDKRTFRMHCRLLLLIRIRDWDAFYDHSISELSAAYTKNALPSSLKKKCSLKWKSEVNHVRR